MSQNRFCRQTDSAATCRQRVAQHTSSAEQHVALQQTADSAATFAQLARGKFS